jgi:porin
VCDDAGRGAAATCAIAGNSAPPARCGLALILAAAALGLTPVDSTAEHAQPTIATSLPHGGDPGGTRKWLAAHGLSYYVLYTNDVLANVRGGQRRGVVDQGRLEGLLSIDLEKWAGLEGLSFFTNVLAIHNTGRIRRDYVGGINVIAAIEATPSVRLSELWLEQRFWNDTASIRFGQLAADVEFFYSTLGTIFLQSDWPEITAVNLPSGGPAYPLSTPGVRLKLEPSRDMSLLLAVYNGDPAGPGPGDEQIRNHYGLNFRLNDPALLMAEVQLRANHGKADGGLARQLKLGAFSHLGQFDDQRFANDGSLLADPAGSGIAAKRKRNWGVYGIFEQQLYRPPGGDAESGISIFSRISASPSDRNLVDFFFDVGMLFAGLVPHRPDDKLGAILMYSRFSDSVQAFDRDTNAFTGTAGPVRDFEANLELTYQAQIVPGWTVQPHVQYIWHPSGEALATGRRNALVVGSRSMWRY